MKVGCWMLRSHSNAGTLVLCTGSCIIHSWKSNQEKTGKSYTILVLWGNLLYPFLLQVIAHSGVTVLTWTHSVFWLFCLQLTGGVSWLYLTTTVYPRRRIWGSPFPLYWHPPLALPFNQCSVNQWYIRNTNAWSHWKYAAEKLWFCQLSGGAKFGIHLTKWIKRERYVSIFSVK